MFAVGCQYDINFGFTLNEKKVFHTLGLNVAQIMPWLLNFTPLHCHASVSKQIHKHCKKTLLRSIQTLALDSRAFSWVGTPLGFVSQIRILEVFLTSDSASSAQ